MKHLSAENHSNSGQMKQKSPIVGLLIFLIWLIILAVFIAATSFKDKYVSFFEIYSWLFDFLWGFSGFLALGGIIYGLSKGLPSFGISLIVNIMLFSFITVAMVTLYPPNFTF